MVIPEKINLGSGKDYRRDYLNIDINDYWSPDIVADISGVFLQNGSRTFTTKRFGDVTVANDSFDEIIATDVRARSRSCHHHDQLPQLAAYRWCVQYPCALRPILWRLAGPDACTRLQ